MSLDDGDENDCDGIDFKWMQNDLDDSAEDEDWPERDGGPLPKFYMRDINFRGRMRRILLKNPDTRIAIAIIYIVIKIIICLLYVVRVCLDDFQSYACDGSPCNATQLEGTGDSEGFTSTKINWYIIAWVHRPMALWIFQVVLSSVTFLKSCLIVSITTKRDLFGVIASRYTLLELFCSLPMIATVFWPAYGQHVFIPLFMNCWLGLMAFRRLLNDLHLVRQKFQTMSVTLSQQFWFLVATLACLIFTTICGIQHIQRGSEVTKLNMFEAVYFVIVTLSTVGYGDISPDIWLGQLFMLMMICVAFAFIPRRLEEIASTWSQRQKMGVDFSKRASARSKHVVVIGSDFSTESVMNFLNEFFEHPKLEHYTVLLMSSEELDDNMQFILKDPKWTNRVVYIRGSALKDIDLNRCRIHEAEACFFLVNKKCYDMKKNDHHTVLRSWAVKDYAPNCAQYIQLYKASNKIHVKFAEHVVCEDEFKFALLANNCLYPGLSTLVTLLLHTSKGHEGRWAPETWQQIYGRHSGNEIYHIQLQRSVLFKDYEGKQFTFASADAHQKYGVSLMAVLDTMATEPKLQLNPGHGYIMKSSDYCFYMSLGREECMKIEPSDGSEAVRRNSEAREKKTALIVTELKRWMEEYEEEEVDEESVFSTITSSMGASWAKRLRMGLNSHDSPTSLTKNGSRHSSDSQTVIDKEKTEVFDRVHVATVPSKGVQHMIAMEQENYIIGPPPSTFNLGSGRTMCHLHSEPRPLCCLEWGKACEHCSFKTALDRRWQDQLVIVSVKQATSGLYNFIIPLRSNYLSLLALAPIVLMVEEEPKKSFLQTVAHFPLVFWLQGSLQSVDDLLIAGVHRAVHLVISHIDADQSEEENLHDAETIVTVQKISRLFPHVNIITEVNEASNMRFMHFKAKDSIMLQISKLEKRLKEKAVSNLPYMFRLPFAAGQVFNARMLDRLLYQTYVKGYLISFVRLLLGIDAEEESGHLSSVRIRRATLSQFPTYGDLYQGLSSTTGEIPIAIYRTEKNVHNTAENSEILGLEVEALMSENSKSWQGLSKRLHLSRNGSKHNHFRSKHDKRKLQSARMSVSARLFNHDKMGQDNLEDIVQSRLENLDLINSDEIYSINKPPKTISYVIVNPSPLRKLRNGDMVYVMQPSSMQAVPNKLNLNRLRRTQPKSQRARQSSTTTPTIKENTSTSSGCGSSNGLMSDAVRFRDSSISSLSGDGSTSSSLISPKSPTVSKSSSSAPHVGWAMDLEQSMKMKSEEEEDDDETESGNDISMEESMLNY